MNKYKRLTRNTFIFFLGEMGTKIAAFFMLRYYTVVLTTSEYGIIDLIVTTASFLLPIVTLGISQGVLRFSMDTDIDRSNVLSIGIIIAVIGNTILLLLIKVIHLQFELWDYIMYVWLMCFTNSINSIISNFCRGIERSKLYATAGVIQALIQIVLAFALISGLRLHMRGYIYTAAIANVLASLIIIIAIRNDFHFRLRIDKALCKRMLIYSIPLIVYLIGWLVLSSIDRYVILAQLSTSDNGMYSAASKIPLLITTVSAIFLGAWQLSSVAEHKSADKEAFYSKIFQLLHITLALISMVLIILIRPIYSILVGAAFEGCWQYTPFLIISATFSCFASFAATNYVAMKETRGAVYTMTAAAVINFFLNILLTRRFGINGTAFATMISFIILWLLITFNTAKYVRIRINYIKFAITYLLLLIQAFIIASGNSLYYAQIALLIIMVWINFKDIITVYKKIVVQLNLMRQEHRGKQSKDMDQ